MSIAFMTQRENLVGGGKLYMRFSDCQWRMVSDITIQFHPPQALLPTNRSTDQQTKANFLCEKATYRR